MVEITGERKRKVPVIITDDVKKAIVVLNKTRNEGKVANENEYVFAVNNGKSKKPLRGHDVIKNVCSKIKLKDAKLITSTNLRKYVATISQLVDMTETEMGWLARHLGHDIHVHKDFYRLPDTTLELAVVGNLLMAVDEGRTHLFKGKNPREIQLASKQNCYLFIPYINAGFQCVLYNTKCITEKWTSRKKLKVICTLKINPARGKSASSPSMLTNVSYWM